MESLPAANIKTVFNFARQQIKNM